MKNLTKLIATALLPIIVSCNNGTKVVAEAGSESAPSFSVKPSAPVLSASNIQEPKQPELVTITNSNWSLSLIDYWQVMSIGDNKLLAANNKSDVWFLFIKNEQDKSVDEYKALTQYAIDTVNTLKQKGFNVLDAGGRKINNNNFLYSDLLNGNQRVLTWFMVKGGYNYGLFCVGSETDYNNYYNDCVDIVKSLKIK